MNLPNKITIARILLVPLMMIIPYIGIKTKILYGLPLSNIIILVIFLTASFTDYLDGHIARKRNLVTNFGKFLDPIADKLLVITALVMLLEMRIIPSWIVVVIVAREFMVSAIRMLVASEGKVIAASKLGKIKTVTQIIAISFAFIDVNPFFKFIDGSLTNLTLLLNVLSSVSMLVAVIATIWSGTDYFIKSKDVILNTK